MTYAITLPATVKPYSGPLSTDHRPSSTAGLASLRQS